MLGEVLQTKWCRSPNEITEERISRLQCGESDKTAVLILRLDWVLHRQDFDRDRQYGTRLCRLIHGNKLSGLAIQQIEHPGIPFHDFCNSIYHKTMQVGYRMIRLEFFSESTQKTEHTTLFDADGIALAGDTLFRPPLITTQQDRDDDRYQQEDGIHEMSHEMPKMRLALRRLCLQFLSQKFNHVTKPRAVIFVCGDEGLVGIEDKLGPFEFT